MFPHRMFGKIQRKKSKSSWLNLKDPGGTNDKNYGEILVIDIRLTSYQKKLNEVNVKYY